MKKTIITIIVIIISIVITACDRMTPISNSKPDTSSNPYASINNTKDFKTEKEMVDSINQGKEYFGDNKGKLMDEDIRKLLIIDKKYYRPKKTLPNCAENISCAIESNDISYSFYYMVENSVPVSCLISIYTQPYYNLIPSYLNNSSEIAVEQSATINSSSKAEKNKEDYLPLKYTYKTDKNGKTLYVVEKDNNIFGVMWFEGEYLCQLYLDEKYYDYLKEPVTKDQILECCELEEVSLK